MRQCERLRVVVRLARVVFLAGAGGVSEVDMGAAVMRHTGVIDTRSVRKMIFAVEVLTPVVRRGGRYVWDAKKKWAPVLQSVVAEEFAESSESKSSESTTAS
ncbi:MAG: hypothetical protein QW445_03400 [Candidatus Bathyarchaeia archaeon]